MSSFSMVFQIFFSFQWTLIHSWKLNDLIDNLCFSMNLKEIHQNEHSETKKAHLFKYSCVNIDIFTLVIAVLVFGLLQDIFH